MKGGPEPAYIQVSDELTRFASWMAFRSWFQSREIGEEDRVTAGRGRESSVALLTFKSIGSNHQLRCRNSSLSFFTSY